MESDLRRRLAERLAEGDDLAGEFRRRAEDYRSWGRMGEAPARVSRIAKSLIAEDPGQTPSIDRLAAELLGALERAHWDALGTLRPATRARRRRP